MNLIKYNFTSAHPYFYIDNLELPVLLDLLDDNREVVLWSVYGNIDVSYYDENTFPQTLTLQTFVKLIETLNTSSIHALAFQQAGYRVDADDCYAYHITAESSLINFLLHKICKKVIQVEEFYKHAHLYQDVYLLFDQGRLLQFFETFEEYLESEYSDY